MGLLSTAKARLPLVLLENASLTRYPNSHSRPSKNASISIFEPSKCLTYDLRKGGVYLEGANVACVNWPLTVEAEIDEIRGPA
jgi:hypothetical protein